MKSAGLRSKLATCSFTCILSVEDHPPARRGSCYRSSFNPNHRKTSSKRTRKGKKVSSCFVSHLAPIVPAVLVQAQLGAVHVRVRIGRVCDVCLRVREWQAEVRGEGRFGGQRVLPAELLGRSGMQGAEQGCRRRRHSDRQVRGGEGQALRGRVAQVHRLLVLTGRRGGGCAEVQGGGATVAVDDFGFSDYRAVGNCRGRRSQGRKAVSTAALRR